MDAVKDSRPHIVHVVYRFDTGGLENGVVNLVNNLPPDKYRHTIVALTEITEFKRRINRSDVDFIALNKKPGHAIWLYPTLFKLFRKIKPDIVHTRNLAALETTAPAWFAGVQARIHSEHGREGLDLDPNNPKYRFIRKLYRPFVTNYLALSIDLSDYLKDFIGIPNRKLTQIYNGVDSVRFVASDVRTPIAGCPFNGQEHWIVGTIGRMHAVKDPMNLANAFVKTMKARPDLRKRLRLIMIGDGPLRADVLSFLAEAGVADKTWLPGERHDVPAILQGIDCFALPSRSEGISNTILEAMACGLPVIATDIGGNPELIKNGITGILVPPNNPAALSEAIIDFADNPRKAIATGKSARSVVEETFSLDSMIQSYCKLYDSALHKPPSTRN